MSNETNFEHMYAYAIGYYAGKAEGVYQNPYDQDKQERHLYTLGYDAGVSDYCEETHPEDAEGE